MRTSRLRSTVVPLHNPKSAAVVSEEHPSLNQIDKFDTWVGSVISPKIKLPLSVWISKSKSNSNRFVVTTDDGKLVAGSGYYGDTGGPGKCVRQHMSPGLIDNADRGSGIGTSLYVAGNMVAAAAEDGEDFPWSLSNGRCTYSQEGQRSRDADRAWETLHHYDLAHYEKGEGDYEYVEDRYDADEFMSESEIEERFEREHEGVSGVSFSTRGYIDISGKIESEVTFDIMDWSTISNSGLVLALSNDFFGDMPDFKSVPPGVFAALDWSQSDAAEIEKYAKQNASGSDYAADEWYVEAAYGFELRSDETSQDYTALADAMLRRVSIINPKTKRKHKRGSDSQNLKAAATVWERQWGAGFVENPGRSARLQRIANKLANGG